jgi:hypothetical protein
MAAPTFGATPVFSTGSATSLVVSRPACSAGDLLIMQLSGNSGIIPAQTGWTTLVDLTGGPFSARIQLLYKIAGASEPSTYTLTGMSSNIHDAMVSVVSGVDTITPINVSATAATPGNTTTPTAPSVTTTVADTLLFHFWWLVNPTTSTAPAGETKQYEHSATPGSAGIIVGTTIVKTAVGASGTAVLTASPTATTGNVMASIAVAPATVAASTFVPRIVIV